MEEATKVSFEVPLVKDAADDLNTVDVSVKVVNEEMTKEDNVMEKEEEDTTFDGGFVKVEKEGIDTKYAPPIEEQKQVSIKRSSSSSQREVHESQEKAKELELLLEKVTGELKRYESENTLLKDGLEEKLKISDDKCFKTEALLSQALSENSDLEQKLKSLEEKVSELNSALIVAEEEEKKSTGQMQEYQEKVTKLESSLNQSSARISELEEDLRIALQKGAEHEDLGNVSSQRCIELEGLFQTSQSKLEKAEGKLIDLEAFQVKNSSLEAALSVSMEKERELSENLIAVMEKLKSAEESLVKQASEKDEATIRSIELEGLHKHSELRIQKAMEDLSTRDTEAKSLTEKSKDLKERIRLYEGKLAEASGESLSLKEELDQSSLENELLAHTNNQLKIKIQELEGYLDYEKEAAMEKLNQRDTEAKDLITNLKFHENLVEEQKRKVLEASGVADTRKLELEEALSKLKILESTIQDLEKENRSLAEVNLKLNQELANHGSETGDFHAKLSALEAEKDKKNKELQIAIEDLTKQLTSEGERLRSQVSSLAEENNQVNEIYQSTKNELVKLQEQLQVDKSKSDAMVSEIEKLSAVAAEKSVLESNFGQVEKQLKKVETQLKEEVEKVAELTSKSQEHEHKASERDLLHKELQASHTVISEQKEAVSQKYSELEAILKKSQEELEAKKSMIAHLESKFKDLEQKVQLADAKPKKPNLQETESTVKGEREVKSRDIDISFSTPTQTKSNKKSDASPSHSSSSGNITIQKTETSHLMTLKIVLGVALVSVLIGIILGKKY